MLAKRGSVPRFLGSWPTKLVHDVERTVGIVMMVLLIVVSLMIAYKYE